MALYSPPLRDVGGFVYLVGLIQAFLRDGFDLARHP
jgi:hypothetical protein